MKDLRLSNVVAMVVVGMLGIAAIVLLPSLGQDGRLVASGELDARAAARFQDGRGLSPCEGGAHHVVPAALDRLATLGEPTPELTVVIAPTFSDIQVVAFSGLTIRTYRFVGQTGFNAPSAAWFRPDPAVISNVTLDHVNYHAVHASISRHIRFAMTARVLGLDGTSYYFGRGRSECAVAWSPRTGQAGLIAEILAEASRGVPSERALVALASEIDRLDQMY